MTQTNSKPENADFEERERIRYKYMLDRIQKFKGMVFATALGMMAYAANATNSANNELTILLLTISCITLLLSLVIAGIDSGGAIFYNEKSQEGVGKRIRISMYICILISAALIFGAQVYNAVDKLNTNINTTNTKPNTEKEDSNRPADAVD